MGAVPATSLLFLANQLLDGQIETDVRRWMAAGVSFTAMANLLAERDVRVSSATIRRWAKTLEPLDIDTEAAS